jgi:hypothetical protein
VYTSCGFQSNLQVHRSLARAVTVDSEVATNSRTLHTLIVVCHFKKTDMRNMIVILSLMSLTLSCLAENVIRPQRSLNDTILSLNKVTNTSGILKGNTHDTLLIKNVTDQTIIKSQNSWIKTFYLQLLLLLCFLFRI